MAKKQKPENALILENFSGKNKKLIHWTILLQKQVVLLVGQFTYQKFSRVPIIKRISVLVLIQVYNICTFDK